jgi:hypothetical protein
VSVCQQPQRFSSSGWLARVQIMVGALRIFSSLPFPHRIQSPVKWREHSNNSPTSSDELQKARSFTCVSILYVFSYLSLSALETVWF